VESASVASAVPNSEGQNYHPYAGDNVPFAEDTEHVALGESISPNYFRTLRLPLLRGREFTGADGPNSQRVAIISRSMAVRYWPGESAIGKRIKESAPNSKSPWLTIVGIVDDARYNAYFPVDAAVYVPYAQDADMTVEFLLRTRGNPLDFVPSVRAKIANVDPDQPGLRRQDSGAIDTRRADRDFLHRHDDGRAGPDCASAGVGRSVWRDGTFGDRAHA
jgi:hypothetical protein